ncbi:TetR/AcrR family transcriptional regulator [Mycolicibacterium sp. 120270]|uniref:TetR/AcrR family transcriptional regulator n=1 Tax=Mycolicibacterium sp. 120270 TaxID=3090600 RepID=UPI00299DD221|nr:TetR/AcrR family transcriptional regulator [Mycolicibacterium sp. 120270]MDX1886419.1 TetR/AcrR family transcriptional regulator [Mycolicibacterium sp. 120270]
MATATATSDEILRCARSLIIAGGYNGFSYADIAAVVGIRKASIHHHFPTKVDLVRTLVERYRVEADMGIAEFERQSPDPLDQLRKYVGYWAGCIGDPTSSFCVCALLATEIPILPQEIVLEVRAYFRALSAWLTSVLERGAKQGRIVLSNSPRIEAETFMAAMHGAMLSARAYGDPAILEAITTPILERFEASPTD